MTLTIHLDPRIEQQLREEASRRGLEPGSYAAEAIEERLKRATLTPPHLNTDESEFLRQINQGVPADIWSRYDELREKLRDHSLSEDEQTELVSVTNRIEEDHARRLQLVFQLAAIRGVPHDELIDQLGISPRNGGEDVNG